MGSMGLVAKLDGGLFAAGMLARMVAERVETGISFNPMRAEMRIDPHPYYRRLREHDPVHRSRPADGWVLSRYVHVHEVLGDRSFSADERNLRRWERFARRRRLEGLSDPAAEGRISMLRTDPPDHTRLRNLVNKAFTPRAVAQLRGRIESLVDELLSPLERERRTELIGDFASPLPVVVIAEMLGVPIEDRERFRHWSQEVVRTLGDHTLEDDRAAEAANRELQDYFRSIADQRRRKPREDLISALVEAEDQGDRLSTTELLSTLVLLLVAGNETTTKLIANAVISLLRHPDQLDLLRSEPERIADAIDELIRFDGPVQLTSRIVTRNRDFHGVRFQRGQQVVLLLAGANRDPEQFTDPDRLDVSREAPKQLGFGHGLHYCLGAQLARLETSLALEALIERFPKLALGSELIEWGSNTILRGPTRLPLEL